MTSIDVGNPTVNVIPAFAEASFNVRFNDRHSAETLKALLREQADARAQSAPTSASPSTSIRRANSFLTEPGPLDALLSEAMREVTGLTPSLLTDGGTSDARFIKEYCPVVEFGLSNATIHKVDENVAGRRSRAAHRRLSPLHRALFRPPSVAPMPGDPRPIGVFDSGMGGLTVLRALVARLPRERFVYLGDTARLPYGTKSAETVQAYALQATRLLLDQGVKMLVIACNTASCGGALSLAGGLADRFR